jgi:tRNA-dihydrouridine synthase 3
VSDAPPTPAPAPAPAAEPACPIFDVSSRDAAALRLSSREQRLLQFRDRLYLAPLTTIGNLPFRVLLKRFGVDMTCGEMAMAPNLLSGQKSEWALLKRHPSEDCFGVQLAASHVDQLARCAELLADEARFDFLDLNCGCPIDLVYNKGMGSALLERPSRLEDLVRSAHRVVQQPITVKLRIGRDEKNPSIHRNVLPYMREWGVSATVVHGRSREQRYSREANWDYIRQCVQVSSVPVVGNG